MLDILKLYSDVTIRNRIIQYLVRTYCKNKVDIPYELVSEPAEGGTCFRKIDDKLVIFGFDTDKEQDKFVKEWDGQHQDEEEHSCEHCSEKEDDEEQEDDTLRELIDKLKKSGKKVTIIYTK
ncbi:MAG TPA: hypothetical protein VGW78_07570 [Candidatus Babeliales bacterium]|jgi:sugar/nucleoside kinase (ribokinase family)|nr:hypothetical protein [Candidatus Babeliales bacterium]